ncbi:MAG: DUF1961 family protein [Halanaeroarchaeum sp.]
MDRYEQTGLLYENPLESREDIEKWILEGDASITFPRGRMRMESRYGPEEFEVPHFVHWCPEEFPDGIAISWDFWPVAEPGLCMLFFAAKGRNGENIHDPKIDDRHGDYPEYHSGDIDALHASYYRRNFHGEPWPERAFQTINLRKSHGFHLAARGGDPLPNARDAEPPYPITVVKAGREVAFYVDDLEVFHWVDEGLGGPPLEGGKIGLRQMSPFVGEYADLTVHEVTKTK